MSEFKEILAQDIKGESGLTPREEAFLDCLFDKTNGNVRAAMDEAGFPSNMPTGVITKKLGKHIKERTKEFLTAQSGFAAIQLVNVIMEPNRPGNKDIIAAARDVLDRGGVFKEEAPQVTEIRNMFILPAKDVEEDILVIDHEG